jgi:GxxExxY protein
MNENEISREIIGSAIEVHKALGPGLLESAYEASLKREILLRGLQVRQQVGLPLVYKEEVCEVGYRIDLFVEDKVIIEIKAVEELNDVHLAQILTYLKLSKCKLGLLINFNVAKLKDGIRRVVNRLEE